MSVWKFPVYRDNAFQALARNIGILPETVDALKTVLNFELEEDLVLPWGYVMKKGTFADALPESGDDAVKVLKWLRQGKAVRPNAALAKIFDKRKRVVHGLQATLRFSVQMHNRAVLKGKDPVLTDSFILGLVKIVSWVGKHSPGDIDYRGDEFMLKLYKHVVPHWEQFRSLSKIANSYSMKSYQQDWSQARDRLQVPKDLRTKEVNKLGVDKAYPMNGLLILEKNDIIYVLTRSDIDRIERFIKGIGQALYYMDTYGNIKPEHRALLMGKTESYVNFMKDGIKRANHDNINRLCRAFDVAYHIALANFSIDVSTEALNDQLAKVANENLTELIDPVRVANLTQDLPIKDSLELLQIYKVLPQPDFDYFHAMERQKRLYSTQNVIQDQRMFESIMRHHKLLMVKAFFARHKICPGVIRTPNIEEDWAQNYPNVHPDQIPVSLVDAIDFKGDFVYRHHVLDNWELVKDKAICPLMVDNVKDSMGLNRLPRMVKNQLMDYVTRPEPVSIKAIHSNWDSTFFDVKCDDKPEAKKPHGRLFMEAHTDVRLALSEYEQSVAKYGQYMPGFMQGKGIREKQKMMNFVTEYIAEFEEANHVFFSFDVDKFSPRLPLQVHKELDKMWAEAFGVPVLANMSDIFTKGKMHYIKGPIHSILEKSGNDFEGFAGKKLTFYHLAVMHAAHAKMQEAGWVTNKARYAAQIDDGVMRLVVYNAEKNVKKIREFMDKHWLDAGIALSWDKTLISRKMVVFLNDIRYQNRSIQQGIRAFVKVNNISDSPVKNLIADVEYLVSVVRGAIVAGSTLINLLFLMCYCVKDLLVKWGPKDLQLSNSHAVWCIAPVALGGLGIPNLLAMCGSLEYNALQAGVAGLYVLMKTRPATKPLVMHILSRKMRSPTIEHSVANGNQIRREQPILRSDRHKVLIREFLQAWLNAPVMQAYNFRNAVRVADPVMQISADEKHFPIELRQLIYDELPQKFAAQIERKVTNSRTAFALVPRRLLYRATIANVMEAKRVIGEW